MSLTVTQKENFLVGSEIPHYFVIKRGPEWQRCCGTLKDVECLLDIYPDATVTQVFPPQPTTIDVPHITVKDQELPDIYPDATVTQVFPPQPTTIDVPHITVKDQELPMQQILPESDLQELKL